MKRSEINGYLDDAQSFFQRCGFQLPPFAFWTPAQWGELGPEGDEIRTHHLGWDVTDFGSGDFSRRGLLLFTIRNGLPGDSSRPYCEKIMVVQEKQVTPFHFHFQKTEDIINRGPSGELVVELYNSDPRGGFADTPVSVVCDGVRRTLKAGGKVRLGPGESITLTSGLYHSFYGAAGGPTVLVGEVSSVNDDARDNRFYEPLPRFTAIEEDAPPRYLLCNEYPTA